VAFRWSGALGIPVLAVFAAYLAVWYALVGLVVAAVRKTPIWGFVAVSSWMAAEWAAARFPFGGFGWGRLAYTAGGTPIDGFFPLISSSGVSALIVTTAVLLTWVGRTWVASDRSIRPICVAVTLAFILVSFGGGLLGRLYEPSSEGRELTVAVVQGNVPGSGITALGPRYTVENNHLAETIILAAKVRSGIAKQPDFVVWPENSTSTDPLTDPKTTGIIEVSLDVINAPILVGAVTRGPGEDERQTTGIWWTSDEGPGATYHKRNLVPFGEWVPYKPILTKVIPILAYVGAQSVPGTTIGVLYVDLDGTPIRIGDLICFELAYDSTFDDVIRGDNSTQGAQIVVVQTSNAMFTGTDQMAQQDQITRIRAMESRREILIATTNSLAGLVNTHGRVVYAATLRTADSQVFTIPTRTKITPGVAYRTWFDLAGVAAPLLLAGLVVVGLRIRLHNQEDDLST
jgi:apolipoprotein N-acyltransferase